MAIIIKVRIMPSSASNAINICRRCVIRVVMAATVAIGRREEIERSTALGANYALSLVYKTSAELASKASESGELPIDNSQSYYFY